MGIQRLGFLGLGFRGFGVWGFRVSGFRFRAKGSKQEPSPSSTRATNRSAVAEMHRTSTTKLRTKAPKS